MLNYFRLSFLFLILLGFSIPTFANEIKGVVIDKSGEPLAGANILVIGTQTGGAAGPDGRYVISNLADGIYAIEVSMIGYERKRVEGIVVQGTSSIEVNFELAEEAVPLNEVIVTPGHFSMMAEQPLTFAPGKPSFGQKSSIHKTERHRSPALAKRWIGGLNVKDAAESIAILSWKGTGYQIYAADSLNVDNANHAGKIFQMKGVVEFHTI